jgi:DNA polymerase III subunit gamma/tau
MQAISESRSEEVLRQVDHLISEGHSPTHFARQMVRFLRNATVAKIAGKDSALLQVSSEERERVARVAALFGEEDLTRHLQIMLRTHGELGYKQEQRFHLELGLLKMAHAQKLIPIEQLLSDAAGAPAISAQRPPARPTIVNAPGSGSDVRRSEPASAARPSFVSPFAADSARKGTPRQEASSDASTAHGPRIVATPGNSEPAILEPVIMGSAAPAPLRESAPEPSLNHRESDRRDADRRDEALHASPGAAKPSASEPQPELQIPQAQAAAAEQSPLDRLQNAVLQALADGNQRILVSMLSAGEWSVQGNEVIIKIAESQTVVDMSLSADARRLAIASASGILGRAVKLRVVPGVIVAPQENNPGNGASRPSGPGGRSRAEQDPVVRRMQEKFNAEIRTVIDYREKR